MRFLTAIGGRHFLTTEDGYPLVRYGVSRLRQWGYADGPRYGGKFYNARSFVDFRFGGKDCRRYGTYLHHRTKFVRKGPKIRATGTTIILR